MERDLVERGLDLAAEWRSRRWRRLLNIIDGLPRTSAFRCAYANDDDAVAAWLEANDGEPPAPEVPLDEWSPEVERLTDLMDLVAENTAVLIAANSEGGYKPPKPADRPKTAFGRVLARRDDAAFDDLLAQIEASKRKG